MTTTTSSIDASATLRMTVRDILAGRLPAEATAVHFRTTGRAVTYCREHLHADYLYPLRDEVAVVLWSPFIECTVCEADAADRLMLEQRAQVA